MTLLVGRQEEHPACNKTEWWDAGMVICVERSALAYSPADATATHCLLPGSAGTRKENPIWILLIQETMSGSGISWAICKSVPRFRQTTMPAPHHTTQFFTSRMPFLPPNQQRQSTEGKNSF